MHIIHSVDNLQGCGGRADEMKKPRGTRLEGNGVLRGVPLESRDVLRRVRHWWAGYWILAPVRPVG